MRRAKQWGIVASISAVIAAAALGCILFIILYLSGDMRGTTFDMGSDKGSSIANCAVAGAVAGAAAGIVAGIAQWLIIRRQVRNSGWWVPASITAWVFALAASGVAVASLWSGPVSFPIAELVSYRVTILGNSLVGAIIAGAVLGAITGPVLIRLLRQLPFEQVETLPGRKAS
jgi:hypothetical protein